VGVVQSLAWSVPPSQQQSPALEEVLYFRGGFSLISLHFPIDIVHLLLRPPSHQLCLSRLNTLYFAVLFSLLRR
jgi:hypothetical protein